ncbi:queuosine salvage family protein [Patescibacteria group bacterium]|nr:queuosine salvage family protein [Patescibacteria group bacterium]MBU1029044.1 queuosine salvage family protein [Patescibacteria group bacterium]MBU1916040.1 queuosine salvage family protein [Patescibacteria group bacterium]
MQEIRRAAAMVAEQSQQVRIDSAGLERLAADLKLINPPVWLAAYLAGDPAGPEKDPVHFFDGSEKTITYMLVLDAINFCFWPTDFTVEYKGQEFGRDSRYRAVAVALRRAFEEGIPLWRADYLQTLTPEDFKDIFRTSSGQVPLLEQRLTNIQNIGQVLTERFHGQAINILTEANCHAPDVVRLVQREFVAYRDERSYQGQRFPVLKRAQIFVSDLAMLFGNRGLGQLTGLDELTCFADYRLPQFLRARGVLVYSAELDQRIAAGEILPEGCQAEVEIRANTIQTIELLRSLVAKSGQQQSAREIDYLIWEERVRLGELTVPHHRTLTTAY